ncbi:MAG: hypothetical protein M3Y32_01615 [Pseudomonadota bacterium]|nr:hypothetical protein [Pseudomonadota bacterium]
MNQALLDLDPLALAPLDRGGFDIGWDHAHHGLVPPPEWLADVTAVSQGWSAGKAVYGRRTARTARVTRLWLALRLQAWSLGLAFDRDHVTPAFLARLDYHRCPVRRTALGGLADHDDALVVERLNPGVGFVAGNLVAMSRAAQQCCAGIDSLQARRLARRCEIEGGAIDGLDASAWWRVAVLRSFATALPFHEAARLPLAVLPAATLRPVNAAQRLQALVTKQFSAPGWSARARLMASMLPEHTLRHDFNLFVGALAPRLLEAAGQDWQSALEDAWLTERVQRRWQHLLLSLGEAACSALLEAAEACLQRAPKRCSR